MSDLTLAPSAQLSADRNPALVYLAARAPTGRRALRLGLRTVAEIVAPGTAYQDIPWHELRYQHVAAIRARLAESCGSPNTANLFMAALLGTLREAMRLGLMSAEDYHRARDVERIRGSREPAGRALPEAQMRAALGACDATPSGARDAAVVALMYACGRRRAEVARARVEDVDMTVRTLTVVGKGNVQHKVPFGDDAFHAFRRWLDARGNEAGAFICAVRKGGHVVVEHGLTGSGIHHIVARLATRAGIPRCSPHDFRRTAISDALDAGLDLAAVQSWVGHADPRTTSKYDRRGERAKRRVADALHLPTALADPDRT